MKQLRVPLEDATDAALTALAQRERMTREELVQGLVQARVWAGGTDGPSSKTVDGEAESARDEARRAVRASIDGRLELTAPCGQLVVTIREHSTGAVVRCCIGAETVGRVVGLLGKRVVVDGLVRYHADGMAASIEAISGIAERLVGRPLEEFVGAAPTLASGVSPEEFLARVYGDE